MLSSALSFPPSVFLQKSLALAEEEALPRATFGQNRKPNQQPGADGEGGGALAGSVSGVGVPFARGIAV